ncbi:MAG: hypothetical protein JW884_04630 [Deltaproteobacteria bacterium]|nr:hypothetical protein [Deltaproteobacteria bacterium]
MFLRFIEGRQIRFVLLSIIIAIISGLIGRQAAAASLPEEIMTVSSRHEERLSAIVLRPERPRAILLCFDEVDQSETAGPGDSPPSKTFFRRNMQLLAKRGFVVVLVNMPSELYEELLGDFSNGNSRSLREIQDIAAHINAPPGCPLWAAGFDNGSLLATAAAIQMNDIIQGLIVLSPPATGPGRKMKGLMTHSVKRIRGILSMPLHRVTTPTLILSHGKDRCGRTPPSAALRIQNLLIHAPSFKVRYVYGKPLKDSPPCHPESEHGFFGSEGEIIFLIHSFIAEYESVNSR